MSYREVSRVDLTDDSGGVLSIILETNNYSWKLFARHHRSPQDTDPVESGWWNFVRPDGAKEYQQERVQAALALGWRMAETNSIRCARCQALLQGTELDGAYCESCMSK